MIQPEKDYVKTGLMRGETYRVTEALPGNALILSRQDGTTATINPRKVTQLSVYRLERAELSVGDACGSIETMRVETLTNGDRMHVAGVIGGVVSLESVEHRDGRPVRSTELPTGRPLHLEHAYASIVRSSQGSTNDRTLITLDATSRTTSMDLYYVAISRARYEARVYTDWVKSQPAAIARRFDKTTALVIQRERELQRRGVGTQPGGAAEAKQGLQRQLPEDHRRQPTNAPKPSDYARFRCVASVTNARLLIGASAATRHASTSISG